jgi:iron-sulfur cluster repair protein YtfE (RIC family)
MTQLNLNRPRSNSAMRRTRLHWNVHTRIDPRESDGVAWPRTRIAKLELAPSLRPHHDAGAVNLAADVRQRTQLAELRSHFENDHVALRNQLSTMTGVVAASIAKYGDSYEHVRKIYGIFFSLRENLWTHMFGEEHGLYSSIVNSERNSLNPCCRSGILLRAIRAMRREHRYFRKSFQRIAELLGNYHIPKNSGQTYVKLVHGFQELESLKLKHMQKEEGVYLRALALERELRHK